MFGTSFPLFMLLGFQVKADVSWVFLAVLLAWSLASGYFPDAAPGLPAATYWQMAIIGAAGLFLSLILHELSHSVVARRYGLPIRGITLFLFGGVAEMTEEPRSATVEFLVAVAGPLMSFFLSAVFWVLGGLTAGEGPVAVVMAYLATINLILAVFNLVPAFPLDGGRIFRAFLWWRSGDFSSATRKATLAGQTFGVILIGLGIFFIVTGNVTAGVWQVVLGLFLRAAATASLQQTTTRQALEGEPVSRFMTVDPVVADGTMTLDRFAGDFLLEHHHTGFPVEMNGDLAGYISLRHVKQVPRERWPDTTVIQAGVGLSAENCVTPATDAHEALALMARTGNRKLLVVEHGRLAGLLSLSDLLKFMAIRNELGM